MAYVSTHPLFRDLSDAEQEQFEQYAQENDPERPESWFVLHPVCRRVWLKRGLKPPANADTMDQTPEGPGVFVPEWQFKIALLVRDGAAAGMGEPDDDPNEEKMWKRAEDAQASSHL